MALAHSTRPAPFGAITTLKLVSSFEAVTRKFADWNAKRQTVNALSHLSDHQLRDIGLNRGDLDDIPSRF